MLHEFIEAKSYECVIYTFILRPCLIREIIHDIFLSSRRESTRGLLRAHKLCADFCRLIIQKIIECFAILHLIDDGLLRAIFSDGLEYV